MCAILYARILVFTLIKIYKFRVYLKNEHYTKKLQTSNTLSFLDLNNYTLLIKKGCIKKLIKAFITIIGFVN